MLRWYIYYTHTCTNNFIYSSVVHMRLNKLLNRIECCDCTSIFSIPIINKNEICNYFSIAKKTNKKTFRVLKDWESSHLAVDFLRICGWKSISNWWFIDVLYLHSKVIRTREIGNVHGFDSWPLQNAKKKMDSGRINEKMHHRKQKQSPKCNQFSFISTVALQPSKIVQLQHFKQ